jgi:hypothetical protein
MEGRQRICYNYQSVLEQADINEKIHIIRKINVAVPNIGFFQAKFAFTGNNY